MVIPKKDLEVIDNQSSGSSILRHKKSKVQLMVIGSQPDKVFVQQIDSVGNPKSQKEFSGVKGFWEATSAFENQIAEALNIREVNGFEVGMVVQLLNDTKKYKKGDTLMIDAVDAEGNATAYRKLNKTQVSNVKKSRWMKKLAKSDGLDFLRSANLPTLNDVDIDIKYDFKLSPDTFNLIPLTEDYKGLEAGDDVTISDSQGGGNGMIEQLAFITDSDGKSELSAFVIFEDGASGRLPLKYIIKNI